MIAVRQLGDTQPALHQYGEPVVDLNVLIHQLYECGGYDVVIDYSLAPSPALRPELAAWLNNLCKERGLR